MIRLTSLLLVLLVFPAIGDAQTVRLDSIHLAEYSYGSRLVLQGEFDPFIDRVTLEHYELDFEYASGSLSIVLGDRSFACTGELRLYRGSEYTSIDLYHWTIPVSSSHVRTNPYWQSAPPDWRVEFWLEAVGARVANSDMIRAVAGTYNVFSWHCSTSERNVNNTSDLNVYYSWNSARSLADSGCKIAITGGTNQLRIQCEATPDSIPWVMKLETHIPHVIVAEGTATLSVVPLDVSLDVNAEGNILPGQDTGSSDYASATNSWDLIQPRMYHFPLKVDQADPSAIAGIGIDGSSLAPGDRVYNALGQMVERSGIRPGVYFVIKANGAVMKCMIKRE